jgi:hypothetical protein
LDRESISLPRDRVVDLLPLAQSATMDVFPVRLRPHFAHILYLASLLLFPREGSVDESIDYKTHFYSNHRAFFAILSMFTVVDIVDSLLKGIPHFLELGPRYIVSSSLYFVGQAIAAITRNERNHQFFAIFYLVQTVIISFALFHTLM